MSTEKLYECMMVLDRSKFEADPDGASQHVVELIEKAEGSVVAHRPWSSGKLAYEIEGQRNGVHYLTCFKSDSSDTNNSLARSCKLSETILRHMVISHPPELFDALVGALGAGEEEEVEETEEATTEGEAATEGEDASTDAAEETAEGEGEVVAEENTGDDA